MKTFQWSRTRTFVLIAVMVIGLGLPSLFFPFGRDQGSHAYAGWSWLHGRPPYRDVWIQKGPLHLVPHLLVTALFGRTMWGIRVYDLLWQIVTCWLLFLIGRRRLRHREALIAPGVYLLVYYSFQYWHLAHTEGFLSPWILLGVFLYESAQNARRRWPYLWLSGFALGVAPWFKQTALLQVAGVFLWAALDSWHERRIKDLPACWLALGMGLLASTALILLLMSAHGMLEPMMEISRYSFVDYPKMSRLQEYSLPHLLGLYALFALFWILQYGALAFPFLVGGWYFVARPGQRQGWHGILLMTLCGLVGIYLQGRMWEYQWVSTLPFMALIAARAIGVGRDTIVAKGLRHARQTAWLFVIGLALTAPAIMSLGGHYFNLALYLTGYRSRAEYLNRYSTPDFEINEIIETADYVRGHTADQDAVFVWGHFAAIYYLSGRQNPTRFGADAPLSLVHPHQGEWRRECMQDLQARPPAYIVVAAADATPIEPLTSKQQLPDFGELEAFLERNYVFEQQIGDFELYAWSSQ